MQTLWKPIIGYEHLYEVSNFGNIKRLTKEIVRIQGNYIKKDKILKNTMLSDGYLSVSIFNKDGKQVQHKVHRLVAEAFITNTENYPIVLHLDNDKTNNTVNNLKWGTHKQNTQQALSDGLMKKGDNHPSSKLTEKQVYSIKEELADGGNHRIIAEKYNVAKNTISSINQGLSWKHVILSAVEEKMYCGEIVDIIEKYLLYVEPEVFKRTKRSNIYNWIKENL